MWQQERSSIWCNRRKTWSVKSHNDVFEQSVVTASANTYTLYSYVFYAEYVDRQCNVYKKGIFCFKEKPLYDINNNFIEILLVVNSPVQDRWSMQKITT